ncbi:hypothetical protein E3J84_07075 [Candidatus Aerophobetes bacterium]|uniref:ABC transporter permease n=1 Tax=Aerophobetes bacterium TaxID=2030807 RepID=A0A523RPN5_UNCAE|nr:MAG: hypothetical protein E3J84_07075 [Candidatus Aerophobetes bacterium]
MSLGKHINSYISKKRRRKIAQKEFSLSIHTVRALAKKDLYSTLSRWGIYIAAFISFIASSFILKNFLDSIKENDILISANPLNYPLFISTIIISFYLAILSAISISREKDQGTLEVLFYGPVSCPTYILGKYIKDMLTYLVVVVFFLAYFWGVSFLTNLGFSYGLVKIIFVSIFSVSCIVSFGLFISSLTGKMRNSIIWLIGILILFLVIQVGQTILFSIPEEKMSPVLTYLGNTLSVVSRGVNWISPFSYLTRGIDAVSLDNAFLYWLNILYSIIYSAILLVLSIFTLKRKGVKG